MKRSRSDTKLNILFFCHLLVVFILIVLIITKNHTNIAFWYQSDNAWAPHFVYDIVCLHHPISAWHFADGTILLLDTLPFFVFSLFSNNMQTWILANAIFNLTVYFMLFYFLARTLHHKIAESLLLILSCFTSLLLIAGFKQINFTLETLLISGQHMTQFLVGFGCLILLLQKMTNPSNRYALPLFLVFSTLGIISDLTILVWLILPLIPTFILLYLREKNLLYLRLAAYTILAGFLARWIWLNLPLEFVRLTTTHSFWSARIQGLGIYLQWMFTQHPLYSTMTWLSLVLIGYSALHALYKNNKKFRFLLIFIFISCLSVSASLIINRHLALLALIEKKTHLESLFSIAGLARDTLALFILPIFIGLPTAICYWLEMINPRYKNKTIFVINSLTVLAIGWFCLVSIKIPTTSFQYHLAIEKGLTQCLQSNIQRYGLHSGVANYWIYRPLIILSNNKISIAALSSGETAKYEHYLSTWKDIDNKTVDFWVYRYDTFFRDPNYSNYYPLQSDIQFKRHAFGKPDGGFICHASNGENLRVFIYKKNQLLQALLRAEKIEKPKLLTESI